MYKNLNLPMSKRSRPVASSRSASPAEDDFSEEESETEVSQLKSKRKNGGKERGESSGKKSISAGKRARIREDDSSEQDSHVETTQLIAKRVSGEKEQGQLTGRPPRAIIPTQPENSRRKQKDGHRRRTGLHSFTDPELYESDDDPQSEDDPRPAKKAKQGQGTEREGHEDVPLPVQKAKRGKAKHEVRFGIYDANKTKLVGAATWYAISLQGHVFQQTVATKLRDLAMQAAIDRLPDVFPGGSAQFKRDKLENPAASLDFMKKFGQSCRSTHSVSNSI